MDGSGFNGMWKGLVAVAVVGGGVCVGAGYGIEALVDTFSSAHDNEITLTVDEYINDKAKYGETNKDMVCDLTRDFQAQLSEHIAAQAKHGQKNPVLIMSQEDCLKAFAPD